MSNTRGNLENTFAGESQASRKYLFFAEKAEQEGYKQIAKLFRAASRCRDSTCPKSSERYAGNKIN